MIGKVLVVAVVAVLAFGVVGNCEGHVKEVGELLKALFKDAPKDACNTYVANEVKLWKMDSHVNIADFSIDSVHDHLDKAISCASENSYLEAAVENIKNEFIMPNTTYKEGFEKVVKTAVCHSVFLSSITKYIVADFKRARELFDKIQESVGSLAKAKLGEWKFFYYSSSFETLKLNTIFPALDSALNDILQKKPFTPDTKKCGIRMNGVGINIGEAMMYDIQEKYYDNVMAGLIMVVTPNAEAVNDALQVKPTQYSKDGKAVLVFQPFPNEWADLYTVWNMAFTSQQFGDFPMYWAKLLTPVVGCYREQLGSYIFNRGVNLLLHIIHEIFIRHDRQNKDPGVDFRQRRFTKKFGRTNSISANRYIAKVYVAQTKEERAKLGQDVAEMIAVVENAKNAFHGDFFKKAGSFFAGVKAAVFSCFG